MVDAARQMLDELMGRNRNLGPSEKGRKVNWDDPDFCQYFLVKFCPHDLFVNTRADLGPCPRLHDEEAKKMYENARPGARKRQFEDDFLRFCNNMLNEVDRKIQKGRQRLLLMNKTENGLPAAPVYISKYHEQLNNLNARIKKLLCEAEEAGHRGDVDQAQDLMTLCEQLKDEKEALVAQHDQNNPNPSTGKSPDGEDGTSRDGMSMSVAQPPPPVEKKLPSWMMDLNGIPEKQMEVCEVCGAFLIVGDAQQRIEDHLMGKQHLGYSKLRNAVEEMHEKRQKEREEEEKRREEERKVRGDAEFSRERRGGGDRRRDFRDRSGYSRERGGGHRDRYHDRRRDDRYSSSKSHRRSRSRSPSRHSRNSRSRSRSHSRK
ncbi:luc7-like protein 3 [Episyrphus balteatus]|uniref:luc7-like protein 3 n=1 Tax=Episyrphus balteatus TaxID=286459 RepID=UPI002485CEB8|nr:luc7-like protein 3 [Episyrphus balteatus]